MFHMSYDFILPRTACTTRRVCKSVQSASTTSYQTRIQCVILDSEEAARQAVEARLLEERRQERHIKNEVARQTVEATLLEEDN